MDIQGIEHELIVLNFRMQGIRSAGWNWRRGDMPGGESIHAGNALNDFRGNLVNHSHAAGFRRYSAGRRIRTGIGILSDGSGLEKLKAIGVQDIVDLISGNMHDCLKPINSEA